MKYVLDTNTVSFLKRGDPEVSRQLGAQARTDVLVAQPVIAEIEYGLARLPHATRRDRLRRRFEIFKAELIRVEWTDHVSQAFGDIKAALEARGVRLEDFDVAIAAHARAAGATLATDNVAQMRQDRVGQDGDEPAIR